MSEEKELTFDDHEALRNHSSTAFKVRHTLGKAMRYAAYGALIGVALCLGVSLLGVLTLGGLGTLAAGALGAATMGGITGMLGLGLTGLGIGAAIGAVLGAVCGVFLGMSSAEEADDAKKDSLVAKAEQHKLRMEKSTAYKNKLKEVYNDQYEAMERQTAALGAPPMHLPRGQSARTHGYAPL